MDIFRDAKMILFEKEPDIPAFADAILKTQYTWIGRNRQHKEKGALGYFIKMFKNLCTIDPDNNSTTEIGNTMNQIYRGLLWKTRE